MINLIMKIKYWLILITLVALGLRLGRLSAGDPMNDEVAIAFRAVGLVDSFNDPTIQSTPWEWFDPSIPWWARISFHDHPPLVFLIQNFAMRVFGETLWAARLSAAVFGIASVYLLWLIASRLFSPTVGLLAASLLATTVNHVYISRTAQQESYVIFFILLVLYFSVKALENKNYLIWTGVAAGLAMLTKYTTLILLPIFATYLLIYRRDYFREKKLWVGAFIMLLLFSPVIIYNWNLYQAVGHFDFQFHYLFGQSAKEWPLEPGKETGSLAERLTAFIPRLAASNSWLFLAIFAASALAFLIELLRNFGLTHKKYGPVALTSGCFFILILFIGPAIRFLTVLTPFMALATAAGLESLRQKIPKAVWLAAMTLIIAFEIFYSLNNQIRAYPQGSTPWLASPLRYENYNWGYNELEEYLAKELGGKYPALTFETKFKFVEDLQKASASLAQKRRVRPYSRPYSALIVYYGDFDPQPELWIFSRRLMYHGWPIMTFDDYERALTQAGNEIYKKAGFEEHYFISRTNIKLPENLAVRVKGVEPAVISNRRGEEVFRVYKL